MITSTSAEPQTLPLYQLIEQKWTDGPVVYLLHFETRLHHAQHYIGWVSDRRGLARRLEEHRRGRGARIMAAIVRAGIDFHLVAIWHGSRAFERRLKRQKNASRLCPVCRALAQAGAAPLVPTIYPDNVIPF